MKIGRKDPHYLAVKQALKEGKPVPPEVLADYPDLIQNSHDIELLTKLKKLIANEWIKRFILGASLILFAGVVFYVVAPKWQYTVGAGGDLSHRYNCITGGVWAVAYERPIGGKVIAEVDRVSFASGRLGYGKMRDKINELREKEKGPTAYKADTEESEVVPLDVFMGKPEEKK